MKVIRLVLLMLFLAHLLYAVPPSPEWIEGKWETESGKVWEFERINDGNEGIIHIYEDGEAVDFWGWRWKGNDTYHIKRYYNYYESFVVYVRGNNEFLIQNFRDANTNWVLHRMGKQKEEWKKD